MVAPNLPDLEDFKSILGNIIIIQKNLIISLSNIIIKMMESDQTKNTSNENFLDITFNVNEWSHMNKGMAASYPSSVFH